MILFFLSVIIYVLITAVFTKFRAHSPHDPPALQRWQGFILWRIYQV